jgi:multicomponent Na+:H+ antiporter subunit E
MQGGKISLTTSSTNEHASASQGSSPRKSGAQRAKTAPFLITFAALFVLWILLSGKFDYLHLGLGLISCGVVALISKDLLFPEGQTSGLFQTSWRFLKYIPWLIYQIWVANLHVLYLTFHPGMLDLIDPHIMRFQSKLTKDLALVTFANSITLTPGTITVSVSVDGDFKVHAIDRMSAESLPGEMEERVAKVFGED